jgi:ADP-heptose:LPS heptosyltransferase
MKVNINCLHYLAYKPCTYHKMDKRLCEMCENYQKIKKRILIVKLDALGDVLRTTSILPALIKKYPDSSITWITKRNAFSLLENNQYINRKFAIEDNYLQFVLNEKFDIGICLDADPLSSTILSLANCDEKLGFITNQSGQVIPANKKAEEWYFLGINDDLKIKNRKTYQEFIYNICNLDSEIYKPQININEKAEEFAFSFSEKNKLSQYKQIIGINTGGGLRWQLKKWINQNYIELIKLIKKNYPDFGIILYGGPEEIEFNVKIKKEAGNLLIDTGCENSIQNFASLVGLSDIFFTPDSLGMHISIALNKTTLVIVGPTSPWELTVYDKGEVVYNKYLECIACYKSTCNLKINCMNTLKPNYMFKIIMKYL